MPCKASNRREKIKNLGRVFGIHIYVYIHMGYVQCRILCWKRLSYWNIINNWLLSKILIQYVKFRKVMLWKLICFIDSILCVIIWWNEFLNSLYPEHKVSINHKPLTASLLITPNLNFKILEIEDKTSIFTKCRRYFPYWFTNKIDSWTKN